MECKEPLLSVIVPCYNVEKYLPGCLDSILNQTYRNLEIICVDDGSPDACGRILDDYAKKDGRIQVIHQKNGGLSAARNAGLDRASGKYIGFVDSDDSVLPGMYETLYDFLIRYHADIADCAAKLDTDTGSEDETGVAVYRGQKEIMEASVLDLIATPVWSKLYRASLWEDVRFPEGLLYEDSLTLPLLLKKEPVLVRTDKKLYCYNRESGSILRSRKTMRHLLSKEALYNLYEGWFSSRPEMSGLHAYYMVSNIPARIGLILPSDDIPEEERKRHGQKMRALFLKYWTDARKTHYYKNAPLSKRLLWNIYRVSPGTAAFLAAHYKKKRTR